MQMIFQDLGLPEPKMRVRDILQALTVYERPSDAEIANRIRELLEQEVSRTASWRTFPRNFRRREAPVGSRACSRAPAPDRCRRATARSTSRSRRRW